MKFDDYQKQTQKTAKYRHATGKRIRTQDLVYPVLGLNGEAGEVAEKLKRLVRSQVSSVNKEERNALALELGDILWYVAQSALRLNMKLSEVARMNQEKLASRRHRGKIHGSGDDR